MVQRGSEHTVSMSVCSVAMVQTTKRTPGRALPCRHAVNGVAVGLVPLSTVARTWGDAAYRA